MTHPFTCGGCTNTWTGLTQAHCAATRSVVLPLTKWNGDPLLFAERDAQFDQRPIDGGRIPDELFTDLWSTQTLTVQTGSRVPPLWASMLGVMLCGAHGQQVLCSVVGAVPVDVVNVLVGRHPAVEYPMLIGFDVRPHTNTPPQQNITVAANVSAGDSIRYMLARGERSDGLSSVPDFPARTASAFLPGPFNIRTAVNADNGGHSLHVTTLCHQTFGGVTSFDRHRIDGVCRHPTEIGLTIGIRGVWSEPFSWQRAPSDPESDEPVEKLMAAFRNAPPWRRGFTQRPAPTHDDVAAISEIGSDDYNPFIKRANPEPDIDYLNTIYFDTEDDGWSGTH